MMLQVRTIMDIRTGLHSQVCRLRQVTRLASSTRFEKAYTNAGEVERAEALQLINTGDRDGLERWIKARLGEKLLLEEMSMRELRQLGQQLGVRDYKNLTKVGLIVSLKQEQHRRQQP